LNILTLTKSAAKPNLPAHVRKLAVQIFRRTRMWVKAIGLRSSMA